MARIQVGEAFSMAMGSLWSSKLRTFLTLLGIIIGVLTIIAVVSIIQGLNDYVYTKFAFFGANDFSIARTSFIGLSLEEFRKQLKRKNLTMEVRRRCQSCSHVGASVSTARTVKYRNQYLKSVEVTGVTHLDHLIGSVVELERGHHIRWEDEQRSRYVCIIGTDIQEELFPNEDSLGKRVKVGRHNFLVIGVAEPKGKLLGMSQDNFVRIPISTFQKIYGARQSIRINVHTESQEQMEAAQEEVRTVLRAKRHVPFGEADDFSFQTSDQFIEMYQSATTGIYFAMIAVASLALIVGGIVVMNIMLVAVTERTSEIGIRMAIGARRIDILFQFLVESAALSTLGGAIGIILGFVLARVISAATSMPSRVDPVSILVAICVSASVGLFFGMYPANKAAKLDPIQALRTER
jgi:putative ABC transport system permease protein